MAMVPFKDRDERLLSIDNLGSGLVMFQDKLLDNYLPRKTLVAGTLTAAARVARTDLLTLEGAQIKESDTGMTFEVVGGAWTRAIADLLPALVLGAGITDVVYNGSSKVASYAKGSTTFAVTYPDATTAVITSSTGDVKTVTFDGSNRVTAIV